MSKSKVVEIINFVDKSTLCEAIEQEVRKRGFDLTFIILNPGDSQLERYLQEQGTPFYRLTYRSKRDLPRVTWQLYRLLRRLRPDVVQTHNFEAHLSGMLASWLARVPRRILTRHNGSFHNDYMPHMVKYDRFAESLATHIVTNSQNTTDILVHREKIPAQKIHTLYYGLDMENMGKVDPASVERLREKYQLTDAYPVVGMVSRFIAWKGVPNIIPAFQRLREQYPKAHLVLANASGPEYQAITEALAAALPEDSYTLIKFEYDFKALFKLFDVFVHLPVNPQAEAFGLVYVEAHSLGIPSILTLSGIAREYVVDQENALVVGYDDPEAVYQALMELLQDGELRRKLVENGKKTVGQLPITLKDHFDRLAALFTEGK